MLYSQEDFQRGKRQTLQAWLCVAGIVLAMIVAGLIPMWTSRTMWLSVVVSSVVGIIGLFVYGFVLSPTISYGRYLRGAQENIKRAYTGRFLRKGDWAMREGVRCQALYFVDCEGQEEPFLCYYDGTLPQPELAEGEVYQVHYTGNSVLGLEKLQ